MSLEKRWKKADRPIFILAVVFNPYLRLSCFAPQSSFQSFNQLWKLVENAYKRLFSTMTSPDMEFQTAFREYIQSTGDWSDEALALDWHKEAAAKEVSSYLFSL